VAKNTSHRTPYYTSVDVCLIGPNLLHSILLRHPQTVIEEFEVELVEKKLAKYKQKLSIFSRMEDIRYPEQLLEHRPI
jgi:hypothetical protein